LAKSPKPSPDQQLRAARVVHGSRLEELIRNNQDFHLLHPRESDGDRTGLPLWLRVHWRKNHPETSYSEDDPTGGYPRALKNLHTWMVENQDLAGVDTSGGAVAPPRRRGAAAKSARRLPRQRRKGGKA
jgi:hypothetical protein